MGASQEPEGTDRSKRIGLPQTGQSTCQSFESGEKVTSRISSTSVRGGATAPTACAGKRKRWMNSREVVSTSPCTRTPHSGRQLATTLTRIESVGRGERSRTSDDFGPEPISPDTDDTPGTSRPGDGSASPRFQPNRLGVAKVHPQGRRAGHPARRRRGFAGAGASTALPSVPMVTRSGTLSERDAGGVPDVRSRRPSSPRFALESTR